MESENLELFGLNISEEVIKRNELNGQERLLLAAIAAFDKGPLGCYLSNERLGYLTGCSSGTVSKLINKMIDLGYIIVNQQSLDFGGRRYMRKVAPFVKRKSA